MLRRIFKEKDLSFKKQIYYCTFLEQKTLLLADIVDVQLLIKAKKIA